MRSAERLPVRGLEVEVWAAADEDVPLLLSFIRSLAEVERLTVATTEESLRAALFGTPPSVASTNPSPRPEALSGLFLAAAMSSRTLSGHPT